MTPSRWWAHEFAVRPKTFGVVVAHLTDSYGAPMCGARAGDKIAELGVAYHPHSVLACTSCLLLTNLLTKGPDDV